MGEGMRRFRVPVCLHQGGLVFLLAVGISPGEGAAMVALKNSFDHLCRTFPEDFPPGGNMSSMGVCVMARPEDTQAENPTQMFSLDFFSINVFAGMDSFDFLLKVNEDTLTFNETLRAEAWNMVCVGLSAAQVTPTPGEEETTPPFYKVWVSLHGRPLDVPLGAYMYVSGPVGGVGLCLGSGRINMWDSFTGFVTGVTLLAGEGEMTPANCSVLLEANELTVPLKDSWHTRRPLLILDESLQEPCAPVRTVLLEGPLGYDEFLRLCRSVGGHFPTEAEAATGQVEAFNCTSEEYLSWASSDDVREDGPTARCPVLLVGGRVAQRPCLSELECTLCQVPAGIRYTLFGPQTKFDRYYSLRTLPNGMFGFLGEETSSIQHTASGWTLRSSLHHGELYQNMWVMGRRPWHSRNHAAENLTFTVCNANQFSSNDGVCLPRSERCDGRIQSPDESDEIGCGSQRLIKKNTYYDTSISPFYQPGGKVFYIFYLTVISKMNTEKDIAKVELNLQLSWKDERLNFVDTKERSYNYFPCEDIWTPRLNIFAGYDSGPRVYPDANRTECYLFWHPRTKPREEQQLDDPLMGWYISKVDITQDLNLILSYPCLLRVSRYPFGRYVCHLTFEFNDIWFDAVPLRPSEEDGEQLSILYHGNHDLHDYWLEKVTAEVHWRKLSLTLHLAGQSAHHLVKTFLPSSLMFLICYSSFFFPIAAFNERVMVSLTSLLVLVATDSYIKTSYNTLIDVWNVVLIILCFAVVIANGIVNYLVKNVLVAKKFNIASQVALLAAFMLLIVTFILFYNDVL